jgi:hypothetical protein
MVLVSKHNGSVQWPKRLRPKRLWRLLHSKAEVEQLRVNISTLLIFFIIYLVGGDVD